MNTKYLLSIVCFGEVLWDIFPTHKKIGGAPLNVALRMKSLGAETTIISRVGSDDEGSEIMTFINNHDINSDSIQVGEDYKTGVVQVMIIHGWVFRLVRDDISSKC